MGTNYHHEVGYESLIADFKNYQKQTPKGVSLQNKRNKTIVLKFKLGGKAKSKGCNCSFTIDGMIDAVRKAHKVAEALQAIKSETEFEQWYETEILGKNDIVNDLITFAEAIAVVEQDFWSRPDRRKRKRDKSNPSDQSSWYDTYGRFYKHLPQNKVVNLDAIKKVIKTQKKGTKTYKGIVSAMKRLARMNKRKDILDELNTLDVTQTKFKDLQAITLEEFLEWRDKVLGITASLHPNVHLDVRQAWLWVFSMQVVYGLRIHEVFAIKNLDKPFTTKDKITIPALNDWNNSDNLIVIGGETEIGTTTKTSYRIARPIVPPKHHNLISYLEIKHPELPKNKPDSKAYDTIRKFYCNKATEQLKRWNAPVTETHAFRHLANHNGMQAGIPLEVRAQSMGHTPTMNDSTYKKRKRTQTTIDLLLKSNTNAIDYVDALEEARRVLKDECVPYIAIGRLLAGIYGKDPAYIIELLRE